jgi:hypothetical protein
LYHTGEDLAYRNGHQKPAGGFVEPAQGKIAGRRDRSQLEKRGPL